MHKNRKTIVAIVSGIATAAAMLLSLSAYAQDDTTPAATGIPMVSGGVGEEKDYLNSVEHQYNLKLVFAEANGVYLAEVPVHIVDGQGRTVVDTITKGPILLVTLPPGSYKVTATQEGETKEQKVSVTQKSLHEYTVRFPTRDMETSGDHSLER